MLVDLMTVDGVQEAITSLRDSSDRKGAHNETS